MNREELQRERDELARQNESLLRGIDRRQRTIAERAERIAALDRQLAAPVLPEGWMGASEKLPRDKRNVEVLLGGWKIATVESAHLYKRVAWWDADTAQWCYPCSDADDGGSVYPRVAGEVSCWREIPADWLSQPAKYPRYFRHKVKFGDGATAYVRVDDDTMGVVVDCHGNEIAPFPDGGFAANAVARGAWLEITAAEAEAMVTPVVKECLTTEPTTEQLLASLSRVMGLHCDHHAAIRARILAAAAKGVAGE